MKSKEYIKQLEDLLLHAEYQYRVKNNPIMSDLDYDEQIMELKELYKSYKQTPDKNSILNMIGDDTITSFSKIHHNRIMGSISNSYNSDDTKEWFKRIKKELNKSTYYDIEFKYDGVSASIIYDNGFLQTVSTRGNGLIGDDITNNAKQTLNIPISLNSVYPNFCGEIRGELVIFKSDFDIINSKLNDGDKFKNPRNLVSGSIKSLDSSTVKERMVRFIPFQSFEQNTEIDINEFYRLFDVNITRYTHLTEDEVVNKIKEIEINKIFKNQEMLCDGVVIKTSLKNRENLYHINKEKPLCFLAYKFKQETANTEVIDIIWQVGKRHITPVAILKPVDLEGSTISRATLHNLSQYENLQITIGDIVEIEKAGFIIPHINKNLSLSEHPFDNGILHIPEDCPICGTQTSIEEKGSKFLCCDNPDCKGKKYIIIDNFVKALKIDGIGIGTIMKLVDKEIIVELPDLYSMTIEALEMVTGKKNAKKIKKNIDNSVIQPLNKIIQALGIHQVGKGSSEKLAESVQSFGKFLTINETEMHQLQDFGEETIKCIVEYRERHQISLKRFNEIFVVPEIKETASDIFKDLTFVVTGKATKGRSELSNIIKENGGKVSGSVSKKVDILIVGSLEDANFNSTKVKKANGLGIKIENEFYLYDKLGIETEEKLSDDDIDELF